MSEPSIGHRIGTKPNAPKAFAPGARVLIRDEEWIVRSAKAVTHGGLSVHVVGTSELVQGKEAIFLTELDPIQELKPEETKLVLDGSPQYRRSRLYLDALLRRSPATDQALRIGHKAAIRPTTYQMQPAAKALRQLRPRILMADGVGLGKTIEVGLLLSELIQRGRGNRILVVALKSILPQFQKELWGRFTIPLVRLDSVGIQRVQSRIPTNMNPFYYYDKVIISIDTLKRDEKYRRYLEQCSWDVVVVDECQHVAVRTKGGSAQMAQRARLAQLLGRTSDGLILTSATPHDGRPSSFASLMSLLEPTGIADPENYTSDEVEDLFIRRFKKDVAHEVQDAFKERELELLKEEATHEEDAVFDFLSSVEFRTIARRRGGKGILFRTLLLKAFLSSPAACLSTVENRLGHRDMQDDADPDVAHDRSALLALKDLLEQISPLQFRKLTVLLRMLRGYGFDHKDCSDRIVIFSERIDTLRFLEEQLTKDLKLKSDQIEIFHGTLDDQKQTGLVESFGTLSSPIRVLLASDAAAEGINLHYYCNRMVHFDLPWSLITLEQRNGRIDRFGQSDTPYISYLLTIPSESSLKGDLRVVERLIEKEDAAHKNLGDVAWLMGLHDSELEEERVGLGIEQGDSAEIIVPEEEEHTDFMSLLFGDDVVSEPEPDTIESVRLISDDLAYAREAFAEVLGEDEESLVDWQDHLQGFNLHLPEDLLRRFDYLPPELRSDENVLRLTTDRGRVMDALEEARQDERKWPEWQLFWEQHPVAEWLDDRVLAKLGRHEAPIIRVSNGLSQGKHVVLFQGIVSNFRSQPVIVDWFGVSCEDGEPKAISDLEELVPSLGLDKPISNPGADLSDSARSGIESSLLSGVERAREHMRQLRNARSAEISEPLKEGLRRVKEWRDRSLADVDDRQQSLLGDSGTLRSDQQKRLDAEREEREKRYEFRRKWIEEGMRTVNEPYLRVAAVFIPMEAK